MKSLKRVSSVGLLIFAVVIPLLFSGCVAVVAGGAAGAGVAYHMGSLENVFDAEIMEVRRATEQAIEDLRLFSVSNEKNAVSAKYVARTAQDERVTIQLSEVTPSATKVSVRVDIFGDDGMSQRVMSAIESNLGKSRW